MEENAAAETPQHVTYATISNAVRERAVPLCSEWTLIRVFYTVNTKKND